jgi:hypothetical protein
MTKGQKVHFTVTYLVKLLHMGLLMACSVQGGQVKTERDANLKERAYALNEFLLCLSSGY